MAKAAAGLWSSWVRTAGDTAAKAALLGPKSVRGADGIAGNKDTQQIVLTWWMSFDKDDVRKFMVSDIKGEWLFDLIIGGDRFV